VSHRPPYTTKQDLLVIERYLHSRIPITAAMGVEVLAADDAGVRLRAPIGPNINHRSTVYGGSACSLAILSAWTLLFVRLREPSLRSHIVIQRNTIEYLRPLCGDFEAFCIAPAEADWERFTHSLARRSRARITLHSELRSGEELGAAYHGTYVADRAPEEAQ
jgi:thioesterase domain-containing protein